MVIVDSAERLVIVATVVGVKNLDNTAKVGTLVTVETWESAGTWESAVTWENAGTNEIVFTQKSWLLQK